jgi:sec-independent protein translocase protein TatA
MRCEMLGNIGMGELIVIFFIVLVLFGAGKVPKIAKDLGHGVKEFQKALSGESDEKKDIK